MKPCHSCQHRAYQQTNLGGMHVALWRCRASGVCLGDDAEFKAGNKLPASCKNFVK